MTDMLYFLVAVFPLLTRFLWKEYDGIADMLYFLVAVFPLLTRFLWKEYGGITDMLYFLVAVGGTFSRGGKVG